MFSGVAIYAALTALGPSFVASVVLPATSALLRALARILRTLADGLTADGLRLTAYGLRDHAPCEPSSTRRPRLRTSGATSETATRACASSARWPRPGGSRGSQTPRAAATTERVAKQATGLWTAGAMPSPT